MLVAKSRLVIEEDAFVAAVHSALFAASLRRGSNDFVVAME